MVHPIVYRVSTIMQGGAGFLPSTVVYPTMTMVSVTHQWPIRYLDTRRIARFDPAHLHPLWSHSSRDPHLRRCRCCRPDGTVKFASCKSHSAAILGSHLLHINLIRFITLIHVLFTYLCKYTRKHPGSPTPLPCSVYHSIGKINKGINGI